MEHPEADQVIFDLLACCEMARVAVASSRNEMAEICRVEPLLSQQPWTKMQGRDLETAIMTIVVKLIRQDGPSAD